MTLDYGGEFYSKLKVQIVDGAISRVGWLYHMLISRFRFDRSGIVRIVSTCHVHFKLILIKNVQNLEIAPKKSPRFSGNWYRKIGSNLEENVFWEIFSKVF